MNLVWVLMIISMAIGVGFSILKRAVMINFGALTMDKVLSLPFWFQFFLTPSIIIILFFNLGLFALNMWVTSLIEVNQMTAIGWALNIPSFLLTLFLANIFLGETVSPSQYNGLILIVISMVLSVCGAYLFAG